MNEYPVVLLFMTPLSLATTFAKIIYNPDKLDDSIKVDSDIKPASSFCIYCGKKLTEGCHNLQHLDTSKVYVCNCIPGTSNITGSIGTIITENNFNLIKNAIVDMKSIIDDIHIYFLVKVDNNSYLKKSISLKELIFDLIIFNKLSERKKIDVSTLFNQMRLQYPIYARILLEIKEISDIINDEGNKEYFQLKIKDN